MRVRGWCFSVIKVLLLALMMQSLGLLTLTLDSSHSSEDVLVSLTGRIKSFEQIQPRHNAAFVASEHQIALSFPLPLSFPIVLRHIVSSSYHLARMK